MNERSSTTTTSPRKEFTCRLCRLKCANERSLYEHVTRLHGGKGSVNQSFISKLKSNRLLGGDDEDEDDLSDNLSDLDGLDSVDETADGLSSFGKRIPGQLHRLSSISSSSSSSWSFRNKPSLVQQKSSLYKPNVAIRVAKVAYFNSKAGSHNTNPFKSNIFASGGLRGNFFSQERLQLHSCRIKMKITSDLKSKSLNNSTGGSKNDNDDNISGKYTIIYSKIHKY